MTKKSSNALITTFLRTLDPDTYYVFGGRALSAYFKNISTGDWDIAFDKKKHTRESIMKALANTFKHNIKCDKVQMININTGGFNTINNCIYKSVNVLDFKFVKHMPTREIISGISYLSKRNAINNIKCTISDQKAVIREYIGKITNMKRTIKGIISLEKTQMKKYIKQTYKKNSSETESERLEARLSFEKTLIEMKKNRYKTILTRGYLDQLEIERDQFNQAKKVLKKNNIRLNKINTRRNLKTLRSIRRYQIKS
jgi:hypothetical protein